MWRRVGDHETVPGHAWVFVAVSSNKRVYIFSSKLHSAAELRIENMVVFPLFFLAFLLGSKCRILSSLTSFSSQIWRRDQTCFCRRPVWSGDYSEAGAGQLQPRHHVQGTHWYQTHLNQYFKVSVSVLQYRSNRTLDKALLLISAQWLFKMSTCSSSYKPRSILPPCAAPNIWSKWKYWPVSFLRLKKDRNNSFWFCCWLDVCSH